MCCMVPSSVWDAFWMAYSLMALLEKNSMTMSETINSSVMGITIIRLSLTESFLPNILLRSPNF